jgi:predicted dehydrogenase
VDLIVTSIRVDRHASSIIPVIKAGKDVYVEWPIESNYAKAKELTDLVKLHGVKNVVGL